MTNPSTVWTQLALGLSPIGSIPFVDTDGVSITTDVGNYKYTSQGALGSGQPSTSTFALFQLTVKGSLRVGYIDNTGQPPALGIFISQPSGRVIIPSGANIVIVSNPYAFSNSIILAQLESADATLTRVVVTAHASGVFSITGNANATANCIVRFIIFNGF
jgi:hypothetical protein